MWTNKENILHLCIQLFLSKFLQSKVVIGREYVFVLITVLYFYINFIISFSQSKNNSQ